MRRPRSFTASPLRLLAALRRRLRQRRIRRYLARARALARDQRPAEALGYVGRILAINPAHVKAIALWCTLAFPGENYLGLLGRFHAHLRPRSYVEIGVASGASLALVPDGVRAVGIDPSPRLTRPVPAQAKLFPMTSDAFFETFDLRAELGAPSVDLAFIDGLHRFEQVLRDFRNLERYASARTVVLLHDCLPVTQATATPEQQTPFWTGDVWKIILCLRAYRPDLDVRTIAASPSGLGVVTRLDPCSTVLWDHYDAIVSAYRDLAFAYLDGRKDAVLRVVPNEWEQIAAALPPPA
jgi:hypothetical protein